MASRIAYQDEEFLILIDEADDVLVISKRTGTLIGTDESYHQVWENLTFRLARKLEE